MEENLSCQEPVGPVTEVHNFGVCRSPQSLFRPSRLCEVNPSPFLPSFVHLRRTIYSIYDQLNLCGIYMTTMLDMKD